MSVDCPNPDIPLAVPGDHGSGIPADARAHPRFPAFNAFANLWTPVCLAHAVRNGEPLPIVVGATRIVLFRNAVGDACALVDQCPHRGVALSLGTVSEGEIACPFHGWKFNGSGQCVHVPWNPDAKVERLSAISLPLREVGGLIWIFTGKTPEDEPNVPPILLRPDIRVTAQSFDWNVHWTRVMENMLDAPHLPFVHARTIGKRLQDRVSAGMEMLWTPTAYGGDITSIRPNEPPRTTLRYFFPNTMEMSVDPGGRILRLLAVCMPTHEGQTRLTLYTLRSFAKARVFDPIFACTNARIAQEDKAIIESSLPSQVPPAADEVSVATDAPTLAFRKIWFTQIRKENVRL